MFNYSIDYEPPVKRQGSILIRLTVDEAIELADDLHMMPDGDQYTAVRKFLSDLYAVNRVANYGIEEE